MTIPTQPQAAPTREIEVQIREDLLRTIEDKNETILLLAIALTATLTLLLVAVALQYK